MKLPIEALFRWRVVNRDKSYRDYFDFESAFSELKYDPNTYELRLVYCESTVLFEKEGDFINV